jgi:hypothetical protein
MGPIILANEKIVKRKLKTISPYLGKILLAVKKPIDAKTHPNMQAPKTLKMVITGEKSTNAISL